MTSDKPSAGADPGGLSKRVPYRSLFDQANNALSRIIGSGLTPYDLMAVCVQESMGNPWFCKCDNLYRTNLAAVVMMTDLNALVFLEAVTVQSGINRRQIAKFRMEPSWLAIYRPGYRAAGLNDLDSALLCCSYGMAQKGAPFLTEHVAIRDRLDYLKVFMSQPDMQLVQLIHDLTFLKRASHGSMALAFTKYNAGPTHVVVSDYGRKVEALAQQFQKLYQQRT